MPEPRPATSAALQAAFARLDEGASYRTGIEQLLLALDDERADAFMMLLKEGRGAWLPLVHGTGGRALFVGNALSGTVVPLCKAGYDVVVVDTDAERLAFNGYRGQAYAPGRCTGVRAGSDTNLPFHTASFDLVVCEDGLPRRERGAGFGFDELTRVARNEVVLVADNRFAYKRSTGRRGVFKKTSPLKLLEPRPTERSLKGYRRLFDGFEQTRAFALYPDAREFSHVVALDSDRPRLTVGPREKKNVLKVIAQRAGLFPFLTPSFAIFASRGSESTTRIARILEQIAERLNVAVPSVDIFVATRSNTCLVHTTSNDPRGRWTLHVPVSPQKVQLTEIHHASLRALRERFPAVPVPEPHFEGELEGLYVVCEERMSGWTAPDITGRRRESSAMFQAVSRALAKLVVRERRALTSHDFDTLLAPRFERVRSFAAVPATQRVVERMCSELRERLVGEEFPLVYYHADLRPKHVQVRPDGELLGLLDWGAREEAFLPYVDLLMLVAHHRHQEEGTRPARAWQLIQQHDSLRDYERAALEDHAQRMQLSANYCAAIERAYPVLVGDMAERNWDYSRPRWLHRQYMSGIEYDD